MGWVLLAVAWLAVAALTYGVWALAGIVSRFIKRHPKISVEVSLSNRVVDIWLTPDGSSFRQLTFSPHPGVALDSLVRPELVE